MLYLDQPTSTDTYPHISDGLLWGAKEDITQKIPSEAPPQWERMGSFHLPLPLTLCFSDVCSGSSAIPKQPATIDTIVCGGNWKAPSGGGHSLTPPPREAHQKPWLSAREHNSSLTEQIQIGSCSRWWGRMGWQIPRCQLWILSRIGEQALGICQALMYINIYNSLCKPSQHCIIIYTTPIKLLWGLR